jgi:hypothetical protein
MPSTSGPDAEAPTPADPDATEAVNILVTGADNHACIDPSSPFAGGFGDRTDMGERSDTIMIIRLDPSTERAAVLSFPRDLWVSIAGRNSKNRINSAYVRDDPTRLLGTIYNNFGIEVDHFIQIDFCAFKTIVDGLGGVAVPFEYPARCHHRPRRPRARLLHLRRRPRPRLRPLPHVRVHDRRAVAARRPVRPRRVASRDFLRRALSAALDRGVTDPSVARALISAIQDDGSSTRASPSARCSTTSASSLPSHRRCVDVPDRGRA